MSPGSYIAIGAVGMFAALIAYGLTRDVREWLEEQAWRRDEKRAAEQLRHQRERAGYRPLGHAELQDAAQRFAQRIENELAARRCAWFEETARQIQDLPTVEPKRRRVA